MSRGMDSLKQLEPVKLLCNIVSSARFAQQICRNATKTLQIWQRTFKKRCCKLLRRRLCAVLFGSFFLVAVLWMCSKVYFFEENIPFQRDLKLKTTDVFIDGELDSYLDTKLKHLDCDRYQKEIESKKSNFLYSGVITSHKTLHTLGIAIANTWGMLTDRTDFYTGNIPHDPHSCETCKNMNVIQLPAVQDDIYPPQQKSFAMLQHICQHHQDQYKWFLRADDDGYFKVSNLIRLLSRLDENKTYIIGLDNPGPVILSVLYMQNNRRQYCDGSAVIYSRAALKELCLVLPKCIEEGALTHHEDLEMGRCVFKHLGHQCATSTGELKMNELFYHRTKDYISQFSSPLNDKTYIHRAIHLHKIVEPLTMHNMHALYLKSQETIKNFCHMQTLPLQKSPSGSKKFPVAQDQQH